MNKPGTMGQVAPCSILWKKSVHSFRRHPKSHSPDLLLHLSLSGSVMTGCGSPVNVARVQLSGRSYLSSYSIAAGHRMFYPPNARRFRHCVEGGQPNKVPLNSW